MTDKPIRIKSKSADSIPQNVFECNSMIRRIGEAKRSLQHIQANMSGELARIKERHEEQAKPHKDLIDTLTKGVQTWCEANRQSLTNGGAIKSAEFPAGVVKWRIRPPSVTLRALENIIQACRNLGLTRFIRTREEINKEAMLAEPDIALTITGVSISQGEDFVIEPYDIELANAAESKVVSGVAA